jgi:chromosome segregation ATPase
MSTAGKVLVVLVMLVSIGCLILAGGVAQLHYNANQKLQKLEADIHKAQDSLATTRDDIVKFRDQTTVTQEQIDREIAALRAQQTDLERSRSTITDTLTRLQFDLKTVDDTIAAARESLQIRVAEFDADTAAMADLRRRVASLKASNSELMGRLQSLREQFQHSYHDSLERLGKRR